MRRKIAATAGSARQYDPRGPASVALFVSRARAVKRRKATRDAAEVIFAKGTLPTREKVHIRGRSGGDLLR
jgi:hypothetical protein